MLEQGARLGPYELTDAIGAGGMGEVYRAWDPRLNRDVAIKILPASVSGDPQRLRRFQQEAHAAAALNHPNILAVHDIGIEERPPYIVSELLEGESLRAKLRTGPLPLRRAIDFASQIARGLAAAHDKGIVHRDLKPENIFITRDGRVKILDFGLAKLPQPEKAGNDTDQTRTLYSEPGTVVGTVGYMSPEQLRGQAVDARSDLFALGAILYEMLTGERAFKGESAADIATAVLTKAPPESMRVNPDVPPALGHIVERCLEKTPEERFDSARDVAFALELMSRTWAAPPAAATLLSSRRKRWRWAGAAAVLILLAAGALLGRKSVPPPTIPWYQQLTFRRGTILTARFAPDGQIVYAAAWEGQHPQLFTASTQARAAGSLGIQDANVESISQAGELLLTTDRHLIYAFVRPGTLARSPLSGSAPRPILDNVQNADWAPDGSSIAVSRYVDQRFRLEFPIGHVLYQTDGWISFPRVSPKGDMVAFLDHPLFGDDRGSVAVVDLSGHKRILSPEYASTQALSWAPDGTEVWFSAATTGSAADLYGVNLGGQLRTIERVPGGLRLLDVARDGRLIMAQGHVRRSVIVFGPDQKGERDLAVADWSINKDESADGKTLLVEEEAEGTQGGAYSVYLRKTDGSPPVRLGEGSALRISPDGKWVLAATLHPPTQLVLLPTGTGELRPLTHDSAPHFHADWLPDSKQIVFSSSEPGQKARVYVMSIDGGVPRPVSGEGVGGEVRASPDGELVAIKSGEATWLAPLEGNGTPHVLAGIGRDEFPIGWSADSRALFVTNPLQNPAKVYQVEVSDGKRQLRKEFEPADHAGAWDMGPVLVTPDLRWYSYGYARYLTDMYVVEGLK